MFPIRDENRADVTPIVTILIIALNVVVFCYQIALGPAGGQELVMQYGAVPRHLLLPTLFTSMFLHGGWMHLLGNMWFLWIFGDNVEAFLGHGKYLLFYLACGALAAIAHVALNLDSAIPVIGASGAISGVLGAYLVLYPRVRVRTLIVLGFFFDIVPIPAVFFLGFWFLIQFLGGLSASGSDVAFAAHVGGFLAGMGLIWRPLRRRGRRFDQ